MGGEFRFDRKVKTPKIRRNIDSDNFDKKAKSGDEVIELQALKCTEV